MVCLHAVCSRSVACHARPRCRESNEWSMMLWFPEQRPKTSEPINWLPVVGLWFAKQLRGLLVWQSVSCVFICDMSSDFTHGAWGCKYMSKNISISLSFISFTVEHYNWKQNLFRYLVFMYFLEKPQMIGNDLGMLADLACTEQTAVHRVCLNRPLCLVVNFIMDS